MTRKIGLLQVKYAAAAVLKACGLLSLFEKISVRNKAFVLMYHRVLDLDECQDISVQPGMFVSKKSFDRQLAYLMNKYEIIFVEELAKRIINGDNIDQTCAITFDDGWLDNYTIAFPILKKYKVPATIFLTSGFVGTDKIFWPEELCFYLDVIEEDFTGYKGLLPSVARFFGEIRTFRRQNRVMYFDKCIDVLKGFQAQDRSDVLAYLRENNILLPMPRQMMKWEEVKEMYASGYVRFGAHTVSHELLDQVSTQIAEDEIRTSKNDIEKQVGCSVSSFAYPNGNYRESTLDILENAGFVCAVTTRKGFTDLATNQYKIPRIPLHEDVSKTVSMFAARLLFRAF